MQKLVQIPLNQTVYIQEIQCKENVKRRLLDLGLIQGTKIKPVFESPLGDPIAYEIRGTLISIRNEEANRIIVKTR